MRSFDVRTDAAAWFSFFATSTARSTSTGEETALFTCDAAETCLPERRGVRDDDSADWAPSDDVDSTTASAAFRAATTVPDPLARGGLGSNWSCPDELRLWRVPGAASDAGVRGVVIKGSKAVTSSGEARPSSLSSRSSDFTRVSVACQSSPSQGLGIDQELDARDVTGVVPAAAETEAEAEVPVLDLRDSFGWLVPQCSDLLERGYEDPGLRGGATLVEAGGWVGCSPVRATRRVWNNGTARHAR